MSKGCSLSQPSSTNTCKLWTTERNDRHRMARSCINASYITPHTQKNGGKWSRERSNENNIVVSSIGKTPGPAQRPSEQHDTSMDWRLHKQQNIGEHYWWRINWTSSGILIGLPDLKNWQTSKTLQTFSIFKSHIKITCFLSPKTKTNLRIQCHIWTLNEN